MRPPPTPPDLLTLSTAAFMPCSICWLRKASGPVMLSPTPSLTDSAARAGIAVSASAEMLHANAIRRERYFRIAILLAHLVCVLSVRHDCARRPCLIEVRGIGIPNGPISLDVERDVDIDNGRSAVIERLSQRGRVIGGAADM